MTRRLERVAISGLRLPGDIPQRETTDRVRELAESIRVEGLHVPVIVEVGSMRLIAGRDRVAAHRLLGIDQIEAVMVTGDEDTLERIEIIENLHRRQDDRGPMMARYLDLRRRMEAARNYRTPVTQLHEASEEPRRKGRPSTGIQEAARELGVTPEALRKADSRYGDQDEADTAPIEAPPCLDTLGLQGEDLAAVLDTARLVQDCLDRATKHVAAAVQDLAALRDPEAFSASRLNLLREALTSAKFGITGARPKVVCPYCKLTSLRNSCGSCDGLGYVSEASTQFVPAELLATGKDAVVFVRGQTVPLSSVDQAEEYVEVADDDGLVF